MPGRIVLLGATGYTGRLVADAMVARGLRPVLAGRDEGRLDDLSRSLGAGLDTARSDVADPPSVRALVERGDVLVSTVGPFVRHGGPAAAAAADAGAHYLDSTGEPPFIRRVFGRYGRAAELSGAGMITAFGYDFVPGNLAGAIALKRAGDRATRVDVGYFLTGDAGLASMSGGTRASLVAVTAAPAFAFRGGRVITERSARRVRTFRVGSRRLAGVSVGGSEHFALPRLAPGLEEVNDFLGWFGPASRAMQVFSAATALGMKLPGVAGMWESAAPRLASGSTGGPDAASRSRSGSHVVAIALDAEGRELSEVHVTGVDPYSFTGSILAWGAERAAADGVRASGALGPVDAFGLDALVVGCREAGIAESGEASAGGRATPRAAATI